MPYLEIYPMENCADKISKQLDQVLEVKPNMYAKTKDRYKKLAYSLLQSVEKISNILEDGCLVGDSHNSDEFDELSSSEDRCPAELSQAVDSVKDQIDSYSQFTSNSSRLSNKKILSTFAQVLEDASNYPFEYLEVRECAKFVYKWFKTRFIPDVKNLNFRYNIKHLPDWITYMIILYGYYQHLGKTEVLMKMLDRWCSDVQQDDTNTYAIPYEAYNLMRSVKPESFTMNAVVIGDLLMEGKYHLLTDTHFTCSNVCLQYAPVVSVVKSKNPSLLPVIRTRIAKQDQLIQDCNLTYYSVEIGGDTVE